MTRRPQRILLGTGFAMGLLIVGLVAGCAEREKHVHEHPPIKMPEPNGSFVHRFQDLQSSKAKPTEYVFFLDEWYMGGSLLGPHGTRHLDAVLQHMPDPPFPIKIQPGPDPDLNARHRGVLVAALATPVGEQGKYDDALNAFAKVVTRAEGLSNLAFILSTQGKKEEAKNAYREALREDPGLRIAQLALQKLEAPGAIASRAAPAVSSARPVAETNRTPMVAPVNIPHPEPQADVSIPPIPAFRQE